MDGGARFGEAWWPQCADLVDKVRLGDNSEIVEARHAVSRHAVVGPESLFGGDSSDRAGYWCRKDAV